MPLTREMRPVRLRIKTRSCRHTPVIVLLSVVDSLYFSFLNYHFILPHVFILSDFLASLTSLSPCRIFLDILLEHWVSVYVLLRSTLSWNVLISPSIWKDTFVGYVKIRGVCLLLGFETFHSKLFWPLKFVLKPAVTLMD